MHLPIRDLASESHRGFVLGGGLVFGVEGGAEVVDCHRAKREEDPEGVGRRCTVGGEASSALERRAIVRISRLRSSVATCLFVCLRSERRMTMKGLAGWPKLSLPPSPRHYMCRHARNHDHVRIGT